MTANKPTDWLLANILDPAQTVEARYRGWTVTLCKRHAQCRGMSLDGVLGSGSGPAAALFASGPCGWVLTAKWPRAGWSPGAGALGNRGDPRPPRGLRPTLQARAMRGSQGWSTLGNEPLHGG